MSHPLDALDEFMQPYQQPVPSLAVVPNNRVTQAELDALLQQSEFEEHVFWGKELVVSCQLPCGFTVTGRGACIDPANFDAVVGRKVAREQIISQLWQLEGYRKQLALAAVQKEHDRLRLKPKFPGANTRVGFDDYLLNERLLVRLILTFGLAKTARVLNSPECTLNEYLAGMDDTSEAGLIDSLEMVPAHAQNHG